jgi:hypothetical protein
VNIASSCSSWPASVDDQASPLTGIPIVQVGAVFTRGGAGLAAV